MKLKYLSPFLLGTALIISCGNPENDKKEEKQPEIKEENTKDPNKAQLFKVGGEIFSIPSPVQTAILIKDSKAPYNKEILNSPKNAPSYSTRFQKAMNLGVYGADMGYVTIYEQTQDAISYINSTKKIADDLGISSAFNPELIKRFEANLGNRDSLLNLVSDAYRESDQFLKNNERQDVGSLILAGGWLESVYFATKVAQQQPSEEINRRIAEQKTTIESLIKLLQKFSDNEETADFIEELISLYKLFDEVEITYEYVAPETNPETKTTHINSISNVKITPKQLKAIEDRIISIRKHIVE